MQGTRKYKKYILQSDPRLKAFQREIVVLLLPTPEPPQGPASGPPAGLLPREGFPSFPSFPFFLSLPCPFLFDAASSSRTAADQEKFACSSGDTDLARSMVSFETGILRRSVPFAALPPTPWLRDLYKSCVFYAPMQQDCQLPKQPHTLQVPLIQIDWNFAGVSLWGSEACCGQSTVIRHRHSRREGPAFFRIYLQVERRAFYDYTVPWQTLKLLTTLRLQLTACLSLSPSYPLSLLPLSP